eukprot:1180034-Prorocentrum_minimum.AAC.1
MPSPAKDAACLSNAVGSRPGYMPLARTRLDSALGIYPQLKRGWLPPWVYALSSHAVGSRPGYMPLARTRLDPAL